MRVTSIFIKQNRMENHTAERNELVCNISNEARYNEPEEAINDSIKTDEAGNDNNLVCIIREEATSNPVKTDEGRSDTQVASSNADEVVRPQSLGNSLVKPLVKCSKKRLLVLDINGLLADIVLPRPSGHEPDEIVAGRAGENKLLFVFSPFLHTSLMRLFFIFSI